MEQNLAKYSSEKNSLGSICRVNQRDHGLMATERTMRRELESSANRDFCLRTTSPDVRFVCFNSARSRKYILLSFYGYSLPAGCSRQRIL